MPEEKNAEQAPEESEDSTSRPRGRKPYVKPAFRRELVFETMAAACGKLLPTARCKHHKKRS